jgi:hypothetical protein
MTRQVRVGVCPDFREERWPSMDRVANELLQAGYPLPRNSVNAYQAGALTLARSRPVPADRSKIPWAAEWFAGGSAGHIQYLTVFTPVAKQVEWLRGLGKVYLNTFPSNGLPRASII